VIKNDMLLHQE